MCITIILYIIGALFALVFIRTYNNKHSNKESAMYEDDELWEGACMFSWVFFILVLLSVIIIYGWKAFSALADFIIKNLNL